jgi:GT2 family glycosyltransferase
VLALAAGGDQRIDLLARSPRVTLELHTEPLGALAAARRAAAFRPDLVVGGGGRLRGLLLCRALGWRVALLEERPLGCALGRGAGRAIPPGQPPEQLIAALALAAARPGAGLSSGPPVSVVVTVLDEEEAIGELLEVLVPQLRPDDELVVVDGGSRDGTLSRLRAWSEREPRLKVTSAPGTNISAGRNVGIRAARHALIACTDAGCRPAPDWLEGLRRPFAEPDPPGLVAGTCHVRARSPLEEAQAVACYPDPHESRRPSLLSSAYTRLFGTGFSPELPAARSLAFTRDAWLSAGGFPERLGWVEDGIFGRDVAAHHRCVLQLDAEVAWDQRSSVRSTAKMYNRYGQGAAKSGDLRLQARDAARAAAYCAAPLALLSRPGRRAAATGALVYYSLPAWRGVRRRVSPLALAAIPLAMAIKDLGKVSGAVQFHLARRRG